MSTNPVYNAELTDIHYTNDLEYRNCLRRLFFMTHIELDNDEIDTVTQDENDYDMDSSSKAMDYVYGITSHHPQFQQLYDIAASKMFSTDRDIGLAVLFSYDYMALFHNCILSYRTNPADFTEQNRAYCELYAKIR
jgi:hypothetical protein